MKSLKLLAAVVVALAVSTLLLAKSGRPQSYQWQHFTSPDGNFAVDFPGTPQPRDEAITAASGSYTSHSLNTRTSTHAAYGCSWWEDPSVKNRPSDVVLDRARDLGVQGVGGTLTSEQRTSVKRYPAREIQASARGNATFDNLLVLAGPRIYSLIVIDTSGARDAQNIRKFFDSFAPR